MTTKMIDGLRLGRIMSVPVLAAALLFAGCDTEKLLEVKDTETVSPSTLESKDLMDIVYTGALGEFTNGWDNTGDALVSVTAVFSDETFSSGTFPTRTATDRRAQYTPADGNTSDAAYVNLHQARYALNDAAKRVEGWESTSHPYYQELRALQGYTYLGLGENYCAPIPFAELVDGVFTYSAPLSLAEIFTAAGALFDQAGGTNLAKVGKARALLGAGQYAQAAAAVSGVPTNYVYWVRHSDNAIQNGLYALQGNGRYSVSEKEGGVGLPFRSAMDPRVPWYRDPKQPNGFDAAYELYKSKRHYAYSAPVPLATGVEARLIEAEAKLAAADGAGMITILNALRADVGNLMKAMYPGYAEANPTLAPLTDPGTAATRRDLLFRERAFWLYGTASRMSDLRRMVRQYGVGQATVFPTGNYHKGGVHGTDVAFPLDFDEINNTEYDPATCDVSKAG